MLKNILNILENPKRPLLGPNIKALQFWGLLLPETFWKKCLYIFLHSSIVWFTITQYIDIWLVRSNLTLLLNSLKITMLSSTSNCKVITFLCWQKYWKSIIEYVTKADLYQRMTHDENKIEIINAHTKYSRKITYLYWVLMYTTSIIVIVHPIFKYFIFKNYRNNARNGIEPYMQVVSSWVPFDTMKMSGYLAASLYQSYAAIYGGGWITSFDTNAIVIMVFFKYELELLRKDCADIFGREFSPIDHTTAMCRLKDCHRRHVELVKFARLFESCLSPIMLFYAIVCSIMLCVTTYEVTTETNFMHKLLTAEYLVFGIVQLFMYCWHSNNVLVASENVMLGPYESTWWKEDIKYRKYIFILTAQLNKQIVFSAGLSAKLTVSTFVSILKGAYSYYTLLRQTQMR